MRNERRLRPVILMAAAALACLLPALANPTATRGEQALRERLQAWESLTPGARQEAREEMRAWLRLPAARQDELRAAAAAFARLPPATRDELRRRHAELPLDEQRGWRLGPALGPWYPRLQPLLGFVAEEEREPLLAVLHQMPPQELEVLSRLAFSTPPERRAELRAMLVRQPASDRLRWLLTELDR